MAPAVQRLPPARRAALGRLPVLPLVLIIRQPNQSGPRPYAWAMNNDPEIRGGESSDAGKRFDKEAAEQILRRAADEQARHDIEEGDSYSLEQLQEIATEAGISPDAVRAAALAHQATPAHPAAERPRTATDTDSGWLAALARRLPGSWSPRLRRGIIVAAGIALIGVLVAVAGVGPVAIALALAVLVLILLFALLGLGPI
jgi:hypothetical protein